LLTSKKSERRARFDQIKVEVKEAAPKVDVGRATGIRVGITTVEGEAR
jgi:hypothetical protein